MSDRKLLKLDRKIAKQKLKIKKQRILCDSFVYRGKEIPKLYNYNLFNMETALHKLEATRDYLEGYRE